MASLTFTDSIGTAVSAVYIIEHPSGAFYIGATTNLTARWHAHRCVLRKGTHKARRLQELVIKGDVSPFTIRPLLVADRDNLTMYEERVLAAFAQRPGFSNTSLRGTMTFPTEEVRAKMSERLRGRPAHNRGKAVPDEQKARQGATRRARFLAGALVHPMQGKKHSPASKKKMSETRLARLASGAITTPKDRRPSRGFLGRTHSAETRAKISQAKRRRDQLERGN